MFNSIFIGNPHNIFLNVLFGLRHVVPPPPPLWNQWSDTFREGNTTQSQSADAVRGEQALSFR